jgi:hypothetical protein
VIQQLGEIFEDELAETDADTAQLPSMFNEPLLHGDSLPLSLWGSLACDLAIRPTEFGTILKDYKLSEKGLDKLLSNDAFTARLREARDQVKIHGPNAGFILSARVEAERHLSTLSTIAGANSTPPVVRVKAIEQLVNYAGLDPKTNGIDQSTKDTADKGPSIMFNFGGGLLGNGKTSINLKPNVIEVDSE